MATIVVNTLIDQNNGVGISGVSLREAIGTSNPGDTISFAPSIAGGTINLVLGELTINKSLTIDAHGSNITIDGGGISRVFTVNDGNNSVFSAVTISGLTLANGNIYNFGDGGAIDNYENLTVINSTFKNNSADGGGAIANSDPLLRQRNTLTIINSTIYNNSANSGAGIINIHSNLNLINTTIAHNSASSSGGGIFEIFGTTNLYNSTISANSGGRVFGGGGLSSFGGTFFLTNTIVAGNFDNQDIAGGLYFRSGGHNLIGNGDELFFFRNGVNGDLIGTAAHPIDPLLAPLQDNGGPTLTMALLPGSPALDAGSANLLPFDTLDLNLNGSIYEPIPFDQRGSGFDRLVNFALDLGAFEMQNNPLLPLF